MQHIGQQCTLYEWNQMDPDTCTAHGRWMEDDDRHQRYGEKKAVNGNTHNNHNHYRRGATRGGGAHGGDRGRGD